MSEKKEKEIFDDLDNGMESIIEGEIEEQLKKELEEEELKNKKNEEEKKLSIMNNSGPNYLYTDENKLKIYFPIFKYFDDTAYIILDKIKTNTVNYNNDEYWLSIIVRNADKKEKFNEGYLGLYFYFPKVLNEFSYTMNVINTLDSNKNISKLFYSKDNPDKSKGWGNNKFVCLNKLIDTPGFITKNNDTGFVEIEISIR